MLIKTITYPDFNNVERKEDFYFNLTQTEVTEMEMSTAGGLVEKINRIVKAQDGTEIIKVIKDIILKAYGEKSPDGRRFIKSEELSTAFSQTPAYDILFMEFATNPDAMAAFVNGIIPQNGSPKA